MSISTLSGVVYTNQGSPMVTQVHNEHLARTGFQAEMAKELFAERDKEVEEIRPMEETSEIHPDGKGSNKDNEKRKQKEGQSATQQEESEHHPSNLHLLDILA
jgi:hypothetical protein